jgi:hypothetical protein
MENRRSDAVFCKQRCKRRYHRRAESSYSTPPLAGTPGMLSLSRADDRWRAALENHAATSQPLTDDERALLDRQRRNPGVLLPELQQLLIDRATEQQRREAAEYASHQPIKPETPLDPSSLGSLARRARESRRTNRPVDPYSAIVRPVHQSGPHPWDDEPQCIDAPWSRGRW